MNLVTRHLAGAIAVFFFTFALYLYTLHPAISPYRDSGDLVTAAATLGIAHPTGYPLYVLAGKAFDILVPWGNTAYRINVMSALFGAAALFCFALGLPALFKNAPPLLPALLFLAFSPALWRLSQVSEMYSFNAFLSCALIVITARLNARVYILYLLGFLCGFSMGNHQTVVLLFPGLLWYAWRLRLYGAEHFVYAGFFFLAGFSVYLFLPLRSLAAPLSLWGDPKSIDGLLRIITRADYGGMRLHPEQSTFHWTPVSVLQHLWVYVQSLGQQFTWPGVALGFWGIIEKRKERFFKFLMISLLLSGPGFVILSNLPPHERTTLPILEPHLVLPNVVFVLFIAAACEKLISRSLGILAVSMSVLLAGALHFSSCNYRGHFFAYDYGRHLFKTIPVNGFIYNPDDPTAFVTTYLQTVEHKRRDIKLIAYYRTRWGYERIKKLYPEILPQREILSGQELEQVVLDHNRARYPIFAELPGKFPQGYSSYPYGMLYKLQAEKENSPAADPFGFYSLRNRYAQGPDYDFFTSQIISYYASARNNLGLAFAGRGDSEGARRQYLAALSIDPKLAATWNNLGTLEYSMGNYAAAETWFRKVVDIDPRNPSALYNLGFVCRVQGKADEAADLLSVAWEKYSHPDAGNQLGLIALDAGDIQNSVGIFNAILAAYPQYANGYFNLGLALRKAGQYAESRKYFERYAAMVTDPREQEETRAIIRQLPAK